MRHRITLATLVLSLLMALPVMAAAQEKADEPAKTEAPKGEKEATKEPPPTEKAVTTAHRVQVGDRSIAYTATAGTLLIRDDKGKPDASMFYVAYIADGEQEAPQRPITFLYNGGPGSSSIWLHMGSFAPVRLVTASPEATAPAPYQLVPNAHSLLDRSDLVFVDATDLPLKKALEFPISSNISTSCMDLV